MTPVILLSANRPYLCSIIIKRIKFLYFSQQSEYKNQKVCLSLSLLIGADAEKIGFPFF